MDYKSAKIIKWSQFWHFTDILVCVLFKRYAYVQKWVFSVVGTTYMYSFVCNKVSYSFF